ncbi:MAG: rane protein [Pantoea eucrina]|nr:rane protein [Pantoea eucrina]
MALALVLILEGVGPMLMPRLWRRMILSLTQLPDRLLHRFGGGLVVAGVVIYCLFSQHMQG